MQMDGRQHSATRVLPHSFDTQISLNKFRVAMGSLVSTSAILISSIRAEDLRFGPRKQNASHSFKALQVKKTDMDGRQHSATRVLPHPFNTQTGLHKLWVAMGSLASTSAILVISP